MNQVITYAAASIISALATYLAYDRMGSLMGLFGVALTMILIWYTVEKARSLSYGRE
jgi:hypothetical protein